MLNEVEMMKQIEILNQIEIMNQKKKEMQESKNMTTLANYGQMNDDKKDNEQFEMKRQNKQSVISEDIDDAEDMYDEAFIEGDADDFTGHKNKQNNNNIANNENISFQQTPGGY